VLLRVSTHKSTKVANWYSKSKILATPQTDKIVEDNLAKVANKQTVSINQWVN
jgi:hypothetical protein